MKMNAFVRLIRTIACGVVVLGAANAALGQVKQTVAISGIVEPVDDNADSGIVNAVRQTKAPVAGDTSGSSAAQIYYPPGMEIPLTETEIPGSSYFVGPDGERIDASTMMNQVPASQGLETPGQDSVQGLSPGQSFSAEGVYDGTLAFPMGTFPTTPFGERILSQVPTGDSEADESQSSEIKGALVDDSGRPIEAAAGDGATPAMENGVPVDQVIRPDNSPVSNNMNVADGENSAAKKQATKRDDRIKQRLREVLGEKEQLDGKLRKANQKIEALTKEVSKLKAAGPDNKMKGLEKKLTQVERRHKERVKAMQSAAKGAQRKMKSLLSDKDEAMKKAKAAQEELAETKAQMTAKLADAEAAAVESLKKAGEAMAELKSAKAESSTLAEKLAAGAAGMAATAGEMGKNSDPDAAAMRAELEEKMKGLKKKLTQVEQSHKEHVKEMQSAAEEEQKNMKSLLSDKDEAMKKAKAAQEELAVTEAKLAETKAQMAAKLADAEAAAVESEKKAAEAMTELKVAKAENSTLTEKMAAGAAAGMAAMGGEMGKNSVVDAPSMTPAEAQAAAEAKAAADAKAAAELEVKRRLEKAEQAKKAAQDAEDAAAAAEKNKAMAKEKADGDEVLSLDDQIKRLKAKRDQQIAESETRIRAKQQREIDKLLEEGKAVDSDEVKAAVEKMKGAIKTSEEKLRSRFLRKLERLKEDMKASVK